MMVRVDFDGGAPAGGRALRVAPALAPGVAIVAQAGRHLPFRNDSADELFVGRAISTQPDLAANLEELWRVGKPGALIHLTLPHASSTLAVTRDPRGAPLVTLETFNYYDPRNKPPDEQRSTAFTVERAELRVAGHRGDASGLALARGPFARFVEKFANGSRGSQYRAERWFANLIGGFEEFDVVLSVVKPVVRAQPPIWVRANAADPAVADPTTLHVTSDVTHEAASVEPEPEFAAGGAAAMPAVAEDSSGA